MENTSQSVNVISQSKETESGISSPHSIDARAWLGWLIAMFVIAISVRNPLYQGLLIFWIGLTWPSETPLKLKTVIWIGIIAMSFSGLFNALTVHSGETILLKIGGNIPLLSGNITLEAATFGALNGLTITLLIFIFARFSAAIRYTDFLRYMPTSFFEIGLIVSIAFTLIPNMRSAWRDIQQAQALRGHRVQGLRDLAPLVVPLFVSGLERALTLAEAMEARGYGYRQTQNSSQYRKFIASLSLIALCGLLILNTFTSIHQIMLWSGLALCVLGLWFGIKQTQSTRTRFHQNHWTWQDSVVAGTMIVMLAIFLTTNPQLLNYTPYPKLTLPAFNPWLGMLTMITLLPMILQNND